MSKKENPLVSGSDFGVLGEFRPSSTSNRPKGPERRATSQPYQVSLESAIEQTRQDFSQGGGPVVMGEYDETIRYKRDEAILNPQDQELFHQIVSTCKIDTRKPENESLLYKIKQLILLSHCADVDYELGRRLDFFRNTYPDLSAAYSLLQRRGRKMAVVGCLLSLRPGERRYGLGKTDEERRQNKLKAAKEAAQKAGLSLEQVAKEYHLTHLLLND
jgi:hypothetical protein